MRIRNKRALSLAAMAIVATIALTGCNRGSGAEPDSSNETGATSDTLTIGFSQATMNHPFRVAMVERNVEFADENFPNVTIKVLDAQDDASAQVANVESLIAQKVDAIILSPVTAEALTPVTKQAMDAGIPVITVDREVGTAVTQHIGASNLDLARSVGDYIIELTGGEGGILEIQGTAGASATVERHDGFIEAIESSDLKVIAETDANYELNLATTFIENNLQRFRDGQVKVVYAHNDAMALGARLALEEAGLADGIIIIGIDGENAAFDAVAEGRLTATFTYPFGAPEAIKAAVAAALGEKLEPTLVLDSVRVDSKNVADFIGKGF